MSNSISNLLIRNLRDVFGENDPKRRRAAIDEIFTEASVFYDPQSGAHRGRDEIESSQAASGAKSSAWHAVHASEMVIGVPLEPAGGMIAIAACASCTEGGGKNKVLFYAWNAVPAQRCSSIGPATPIPSMIAMLVKPDQLRSWLPRLGPNWLECHIQAFEFSKVRPS